MKKQLSRFLTDEIGSQMLEYALIAGVIIVTAIFLIHHVGGQSVERWMSIDGGL